MLPENNTSTKTTDSLVSSQVDSPLSWKSGLSVNSASSLHLAYIVKSLCSLVGFAFCSEDMYTGCLRKREWRDNKVVSSARRGCRATK